MSVEPIVHAMRGLTLPLRCAGLFFSALGSYMQAEARRRAAEAVCRKHGHEWSEWHTGFRVFVRDRHGIEPDHQWRYCVQCGEKEEES